MQIVAKTKAPAAQAGAFSLIRIITKISWPAGAGRPGYRDGRHPVALTQQALRVHGNQVLGAQAAFHIPIPARWLPIAPPRCAAACVPAAAASGPSRDR